MRIRSTLPLFLILFFLGHGDSVAQNTGAMVVEPVFDVVRPTHGEFVGTVAMKSFPQGIGFAVAHPDSRNAITYRFLLQQEEPIVDVAGQWMNARVIYNRAAVRIQDSTGNDIVLAVLSEIDDSTRQRGTFDPSEVKAETEFEGYGLSYNPVMDEELTISEFLSGIWSQSDLGLGRDGDVSRICENCSCTSGGAGAKSCSSGGGGCGVECNVGYFACCHSYSSCVCCSNIYSGLCTN